MVDHSSDQPPQGSLPTFSPRRAEYRMFQTRSNWLRPKMKAKVETAALYSAKPDSMVYEWVRRGMPMMPKACMGQKAALYEAKPMRKCQRPRVSLSLRPVALGYQ